MNTDPGSMGLYDYATFLWMVLALLAATGSMAIAKRPEHFAEAIRGNIFGLVMSALAVISIAVNWDIRSGLGLVSFAFCLLIVVVLGMNLSKQYDDFKEYEASKPPVKVE